MEIKDFLEGDNLITGVVTLIATTYVSHRLFKSNLQTQHNLEQRKNIKTTLSKYKVHVLQGAERLKKRLYRFNPQNIGKTIRGDEDNPYSTEYKFLAFFAWVKKFQTEMVYFDTTVADEIDLEFVKFLNMMPRVLCDTYILSSEGKGNYFTSTAFGFLPDMIITADGIKSYTEFKDEVETNEKLKALVNFFDTSTFNENRLRRLKLLQLTLIVFLNYYGYNYQKKDKKGIREIVAQLKELNYLDSFNKMIKNFRLENNREVKKAQMIILQAQGVGPLKRLLYRIKKSLI